jgi:prepilin-type N-terminal cleavage/methylation domain-containing protein
MSRRAPWIRRPAFTLVETLVAVVILGLLVGMAAWAFAGPLRRAQLDQAVEQIRFLDATTRQVARDTGKPFRISIDADRVALGRIDSSHGRVLLSESALPSGIRIDRVRTTSRDHDGGAIEVEVSRLGLSESYAVLLAGREWRRWVLVSGLSGEVTVVSDDLQIADIFSRTSGRRDAD